MPVFVPASGVRAGTVAWHAANSAPSGWLPCNGAQVSRSVYAALFQAIGTTYGAGDGSTTFNVPDLRGEFIRGLDNGRGVDTGRGIGTAQANETASHAHGASSNGAGTHGHGSSTNAVGDHTHGVSGGVGGAVQIMGTQAGVVSAIGPGSVPSAYYTQYGGANILQGAGGHAHTVFVDVAPDHTHGITVNAAGGAETRPRNVAMLACIKF